MGSDDRTAAPVAPNLAQSETSSAAAVFLEEFRARYGRAPRVLHVGNIANNAYLNAKILNRHGFDCDVICYDYYHIMGCPEWEDVDFDNARVDHFKPDWTSIDLKGYRRPRWFAQGPREYCIAYLIAKRSGRTSKAEALWRDLSLLNKTLGGRSSSQRVERMIAIKAKYWWAKLRRFHKRARTRPDAYRLAWYKLETWAYPRGERGYALAALMAPLVVAAVLLAKLLGGVRHRDEPDETNRWKVAFAHSFPDRPDQLTSDDIRPFLWAIPEWAQLFAHYDIVQAYSTDVLLPMLTGKRPYIGFEHGTLRVFTLADNAVSRLTALGYHLANHVLITNGDCLEYAQKIKVESYTPMIHPFDDEFMRTIKGDRDGLHRQYGAQYLFLCPLRHDWEIKGTDKYIRALPAIVREVGRSIKMIMTEWGAQVDDSRCLAESLGVADLITWCQPFNRIQLIRHLKSVDVVFDQIALPCFGGTAPQAIASDVPVIMSYDPVSTAWLIPEAAPILTAWSPDEIVDSVRRALDPVWRANYERQGQRWYQRYHSSEQVVAKHAEAYLKVCRDAGILPAPQG